MVNKDDLLNIYETGQGKIKLRGKVEVEDLKGGKKQACHNGDPVYDDRAGIGKFLNDVCNLVETKKDDRYCRYFQSVIQRGNPYRH